MSVDNLLDLVDDIKADLEFYLLNPSNDMSNLEEKVHRLYKFPISTDIEKKILTESMLVILDKIGQLEGVVSSHLTDNQSNLGYSVYKKMIKHDAND